MEAHKLHRFQWSHSFDQEALQSLSFDLEIILWHFYANFAKIYDPNA